MKEVSVCLSGGGTRGAIHLGVLQYMLDHDYSIKAISGTSIGALLGSMIAGGYGPRELIELMLRKHITHLFTPTPLSKGGLFSLKKIEKLILNKLPYDTFTDLKIPFFCCATNLSTGEYEIFGSGTLHDKILASISVPLIFEPVTINGDVFVDGGLLNNLPVEPLLKNDYPVIGVHVNNYVFKKLSSPNDILKRVVSISVRQSVLNNSEKCDIFINPFLEKDYAMFDLKVAKELYQIGYNEAKKILG